MKTRIMAGAALGVVLTLGACNQAGPVTGSTSQCVDIPDVDLFTVQGGKFIPASGATMDVKAIAIPALVAGLGYDWMLGERNGSSVDVQGIAPDATAKQAGFEAARAAIMAHPDAVSGEIATVNDRITLADGTAELESRMKGVFSGLGFPWMGLNINGRVGTLTGTAPDATAKEIAYEAGRTAIEADAEISDRLNVIVDGIAIEGGNAGMGAAIAGLPSNPTAAQCQNAFVQVMDGRNVEFEVNLAVIDSVSARLLDAATGAALLCDAYNIEIGGHTDSRGSDDYNLGLSQNRADAVRQYLIERGVPAAGLTAVGYGETRPLDPAMTNEAYNMNRRTEFTVRPR